MLHHLQRVVDGRLRGVHDEVSKSEAEALGGSAQVKRLGPRPGKRLLLWPGGGSGRRLALVTAILRLSLGGKRTKNRNILCENRSSSL